MADVEEPQFNTLAERIAALNRQKNFSTADAPKKRAPPPPPQAASTPAQPPIAVQSPPLPSRNSYFQQQHQQPSPAPRPRCPSPTDPAAGCAAELDLVRHLLHLHRLQPLHRGRNNSSSASFVSTDGQPTRKLPPAYNPATLPPLPPSRRESEAKEAAAKQNAVKSKYSPSARAVEPPPPPSQPPRLPSRPARSPGLTPTDTKSSTPRRLPPAPSAYVKPPPVLPSRPKSHENGASPPLPSSNRNTRDAPPPVPVASRPSVSQIEDAVAKATANCLLCRDFSGPDAVGAQFPRHGARAIFTWAHHNVVYDYEMFSSGNIRHVSPEEAIAKRAGMECVMVTGHGKGAGYTPLKKGERCPPKKPDGHAWNAVRIDGGEWKLLDACWGAGHLDRSTNTYKQKFSPIEFCASNEVFGRRHFPRDPNQFFRADGQIPTWEEYFTGGSRTSPGQVVRFQFSNICEHWAKIHRGEPRKPFLLTIHGLDGRQDSTIPFETDGYWWWLDVNARDLGAPGKRSRFWCLRRLMGGTPRAEPGIDLDQRKPQFLPLRPNSIPTHSLRTPAPRRATKMQTLPPTLTRNETLTLLTLSGACLAILANTFNGDGEPSSPRWL
ncbi:unnamed protein product [Parascedosporium putredinis]|uniref:Transglutaminase-like domain-containing protein n=1 Tax=Parascedosporium putredinis TaxID=1442378 RepID=A0A9P1H806_9PEZI|nr:unnamed protein product [Parascedosporium putredinis]CAI7998879.1 unnamed protein product [Parascedosporium putredinis]